ncbi:DNA repair protein RadA [Alphaproteobacteria bacterium]|nr:DNA repair protein RadA [Alphaproteobacteria bacterium]
MSKSNKQYVCQACGTLHLKWSGKCEQCNKWNSLLEENISKPSGPLSKSSGHKVIFEYLKDDTLEYPRLKTNFSEINRVIGGGFVSGSVTLIGGDPGIGKSTLLLQLVGSLSKKGEQCIYVSGEESLSQIKMRANRLGIKDSNIQFASVTNASDIATTISSLKKRSVLIIDSIQTMYLPQLDSSPGTVTQVRSCTHELIISAKKTNSILILIGHVTKDGTIAGPRVLEHMVDTVLYFEGDNNFQYRVLRSIKNRFGPTNEIGVFEMLHAGLKEIINPSKLFLSDRQKNVSGSAIFAGLEGTRPILIEVQALVMPSSLASPRRTIVGWDTARLSMLSAVLESRCKIHLSNMDIFLNIAGGIKIFEPAADLAVAAAIISSVKDIPISFSSVFFGEIGLSGEIRKVNQPELRIKEASKLGFDNIILPSKQKVIIDKNMSYNNITLLSDLVNLINNNI